ncbi:MAG: endonuclease [Frondihabitans sp.]|nr:endonuclease [Frondihabitans sp.]
MAGREDLWDHEYRTKQRPRILARDGYTCQACGATPEGLRQGMSDLTADHIDPMKRTRRKRYADHELITLCRSCNSRKGAKVDARIDYRNNKYQ